MKDVVIINDYIDYPGGATAVARATASILAAKGHRITFIAGTAGGDSPTELPGCKVECLGLSDVRDLGRAAAAARGLYNWEAARRLRAVLRDRAPATTTVLLHQWTRTLSASVFRVLRPYRTLLFAHDFFATCPNGALYDFQLKEFCGLKPLSRACLRRNCDRESRKHKLIRVGRTIIQNLLFGSMAELNLVFVSAGQAEKYGEIFPCKAEKHVLANVPELRARKSVHSDIAHAAEGRLLFVGRMTAEKGAAELAEAGRLLGESIDFLGDGPLRLELERAYPEHRFHAWGDREEVERRMAASRLVVVPSRWPETSCLVSWEALHLGTPVAVADVLCSAGELKATGGAVTIDARTPESLARSLAEQLRPDELAGVRRGAAAFAQEAQRSEKARVYGEQLAALLTRTASGAEAFRGRAAANR